MNDSLDYSYPLAHKQLWVWLIGRQEQWNYETERRIRVIVLALVKLSSRTQFSGSLNKNSPVNVNIFRLILPRPAVQESYSKHVKNAVQGEQSCDIPVKVAFIETVPIQDFSPCSQARQWLIQRTSWKWTNELNQYQYIYFLLLSTHQYPKFPATELWTYSRWRT